MPDETLASSTPTHSAPDSPAGPPGFELLAEVGRGGMGVVWRARDVSLDREVAVKLLSDKYAPDSATARRFRDEARITGQLQHPGIPAVYQVGTLADGRPFLAMKLIKGNTLADRLKAGDPLDPLGVFQAVAQAVGYAHAHGVIHRDLKPANVMVGAHGEVQVLDWGLAKVLTVSREAKASEPSADPEATVGTATQIKSLRDSDGTLTQAGSILGTPAFMAPEQAAGETGRIDARADVFGLGAILCVLLTGQPPFDGRDAESVRLNAVRGKTEAAFARLDAGGADPGVVGLCKRCLAAEPADRPASGDVVAGEVAALRSAADDRAKAAERDRHAAEVRAAEGRKRRRAILWAGGGLAAVLLLGLAGTTAGLVRADRSRRAAVAAEAATEEKRAEAAAREAEANATVAFFEDQVFAAARPKGQDGGLGHDVTLRDAIAAGLPALAAGFKDQPLVEARLRRSLGVTYYRLGDNPAAVRQLERARAVFTQLLGPDHPDTLSAMHKLATSYSGTGRKADALALREETLAARRRILGPDHPDTLGAMHNLATSYDDAGRKPDALRLREETLAGLRRVLGPDHPQIFNGQTNLANSYDDAGRKPDALRLREEALAGLRRVLGPDHPDTLSAMHNLATSYSGTGRKADALALREETLAARRRILGPDHPDTLSAMHNLATSYIDAGRTADALKLLEEVHATSQRVSGADHPDTLTAVFNLASSYDAVGRRAEALKLHEACLANRRRTLGPDHPDTVASMILLSIHLGDGGRRPEALALAEPALAASRRVFGPDHPKTLSAMNALAYAYAAAGRTADASRLREETLAAQRRVLPPDHPDTLSSMYNLANSSYALGRHADALRLYEEALTARRRVLGPDHPDVFNTMWGVAATLVKLNRGAEAVPVIDGCVAVAAGKVVAPLMIQTVMELRSQHFQKMNDPAGCRTTAEMWEKLNRPDADDLYEGACFRAVAAGLYAKANQPAEATADADRAMAWLTKAVTGGYKDRAHMDKDADLDVLRGRADFRALLNALPERAPPPRPAR